MCLFTWRKSSWWSCSGGTAVYKVCINIVTLCEKWENSSKCPSDFFYTGNWSSTKHKTSDWLIDWFLWFKKWQIGNNFYQLSMSLCCNKKQIKQEMCFGECAETKSKRKREELAVGKWWWHKLSWGRHHVCHSWWELKMMLSLMTYQALLHTKEACVIKTLNRSQLQEH